MPNFQMFSDFIGICRTCMIKSDDLTSVFNLKTINKVKQTYAQMIKICTSVEVSFNFNLQKILMNQMTIQFIFLINKFLMLLCFIQILESKQISTSICNECASKIFNAYEFRLSCLHSKNQINSAFELLNTSMLEEDEELFRELYDKAQNESESTSESSLDYGDDQIDYEDSKRKTVSKKLEIETDEKFKQKRKYTRKPENPPKQSYLCSICGKLLGDRYRYEDHYKMHFPEKCMKCRFCDKVFSIAANRKIHEKLHSEGI